MNVIILGASNKKESFAYKANVLLQEYNHKTFLVNPKHEDIEGQKVYKSISDIQEDCHTLTLYVGPAISSSLSEEIIAKKLERVIFNPGSENEDLAGRLQKMGRKVTIDCTLILLEAKCF